MSELACGSNLPEKTLCITRGEHKIRDAIDWMYGGKFRYVIIDVDGEQHMYDADALISLLESLEVDDGK